MSLNNVNCGTVSKSLTKSAKRHREHFIYSSSLKLITYDISKNFANINFLTAEFSKPNTNILFVVNETSFLANLEKFNLYGVKLDDKNFKTSGLTLYISNHLRQFTTVKFGKFSIYGQIDFPSCAKSDGCRVGFVATYRNPTLNNTDLNDLYFEELADILHDFYSTTDLTYLLGDLNLYNQRYNATDFQSIIEVSKYLPAVKSFKKLQETFTGNFASLFTGVTHVPRSTVSKTGVITAAQLDYIYCQYPGDKYPKGKSKLISGSDSSDHFCLQVVVNLPKFTPNQIVFDDEFKLFEPDYTLVNDTMTTLLINRPITSNSDLDFLNFDSTKFSLLEATGVCRKRSIPNKLTNPHLIKICILQERANKARRRGDMISFRKLEDEIRVVIAQYLSHSATTASKEKSSSDFHLFAGALLKPVKCSLGKYTMRNSTASEISSEISSDYINNDADLSWKNSRDFFETDRELVLNMLDKFDFRATVTETKKPVPGFKDMLDYHALLSYQICRAIVLSGVYTNSLKVSKCTLLPSRSIFSAIYPEAKVCEKFFLSLIKPEIDKTHNFAYREKFSCTSLLLNQFHNLACTESVYIFNADIRKAFNTMSRSAILNSISNPFLANILGSWMCRKDAPFCLDWEGFFQSFSRVDWNGGIEPGSNLGPFCFILGLGCYIFMYLRALARQKGLFADDGGPQYDNTGSLLLDARDYYKHVCNLGMKLHTSGDKQMCYMAIGKIDPNLNDLSLKIENQIIPIKRSFEVRQLGLYFGADVNGNMKINISSYIDRLKMAVVQLRALSDLLPSSVLVILIRAYCVSIFSYNIVVYLPILWHQKDKQLDQLRYWYCCLKAVASAGCLDVMKGSNKSKSLKVGSETEDFLTELTGLETLEELYFMSCCSHLPQLHNLHKFNLLDESIGLQARTNKFFVRKKILKGRISPIATLIESINLIIDNDPVSARGMVKGIDFLKSVEVDFKHLDGRSIRAIQKAISLHACGKFVDCSRARSKFTDEKWRLIQSNFEYIESKKASLIKLATSREIYKSNIVISPLLFTKFSTKKF